MTLLIPPPYKILFADDTNLFFSHKNPNTLEQIINSELVKIDTWFKCNKLSLNINKTNYILFRSHKKNDIKQICPKINGQNIERVGSTKFLGIHIDEFLNFKRHIDDLTTKLNMLPCSLSWDTTCHSLHFSFCTNLCLNLLYNTEISYGVTHFQLI